MALWTLADLEAEISPEVCRQYLDDDNAGEVDPVAVARLQVASDSEVLSWIGPVKGVDRLVASGDARLKQLSLDAARFRLERRHPEYARRDWKDLRDTWKEDIADVRKGLTQLLSDPNDAANVQVYTDPVGGNPGDPIEPFVFNTCTFRF